MDPKLSDFCPIIFTKFSQIEKSRERTDVANVRTIADAVQRYMMENTEAPIGAVDEDHELITQGYLAAPPQDPWGNNNKYSITTSNKDIIITGVGKDKYSITLEGAVP